MLSLLTLIEQSYKKKRSPFVRGNHILSLRYENALEITVICSFYKESHSLNAPVPDGVRPPQDLPSTLLNHSLDL